MGHRCRTCCILVVVTNKYIKYDSTMVKWLCYIYISVHVGRNFHVLYSCVVIIIMMFRGCSLLLLLYLFMSWLWLHLLWIYIRVVVVYILYDDHF